jgi:choline dehydrogenase-like flavoprotein
LAAERCDVAVVGGGVSGALTALALSKAGFDVVVVDRRTPGKGSTLASTAMIQFEIDTPLFSVIVKDLSGDERFRWNLFEFGLTEIGPGDDGRNRYTFEAQDPPDNIVRIDSPGFFPAETSFNTATDTRVEIEGIQVGPYPVVEVDTASRTITLTFDYVEAGEAYDWIHRTALGLDHKRAMSIIQETGGLETSRTNYFEIFPMIFRHFTGFGQTEKVKLRIVIAYGFAELG